jgi:hypothetical protein
MSIIRKIRRAIVARIPGSEINIAVEKRRLERDLRADGWSRAAAKTETQRRHNGRT